MLAATTADGGLSLWRDDAQDAPVHLDGHSYGIDGLAWHPTRRILATVSQDYIRRWDVDTGQHVIVGILDVVALSLAWAPDGSRLAVTDFSGSVGVWDPFERRMLAYERPHHERLHSVVWAADGNTLFLAADAIVFALMAADLSGRRNIMSGGGGSCDIALAADGMFIAVGYANGTIRVAETRSEREVAILEGHSDRITCLSFSASSGLLASTSEGEVRLWRCTDWECVAILSGGGFSHVGSLDFHPRDARLATKARNLGGIDRWKLDIGLLAARPVALAARRYVNAKVVLLGDTGVGKSGLGLVLSGRSYAPTDSTHGRNVWVFEPTDDDRSAAFDTREVLLWDLAGQPGYRLVHQLHLNEVAVALIVFDARSETDPFSGVKHWMRALAQARRLEADAAVPARTFLIAARADRGGVPASKERVRAFVDEFGLDGYFETSAKEGWQISELREAMLAAIDWHLLPTVSSNAMLEEIRAFLLDAKREQRVLATVEDLYRDYSRARTIDAGGRDPRAEFEACLGRVEGRGLVRRLHFGGFILLQPELLDSYASALVQAAKEEPDGLGAIAEADALSATFRLAATERIQSREQEKLLLIATVEELLRHEVALKETTDRGVDLVFPSQFTRERPGAPHFAGRELTFRFEGSLHNIYATLAVRLARSLLFIRTDMWRNAATYSAAAGGLGGIYLREIDEGVGELEVFFEEPTGAAVRRQFETYVSEHLHQRAAPGTVSKRRVLACPGCRYSLPDDLVEHKLARGARKMRCPDCEQHTITLVRAEDQATRPHAAVTEMHISANARRDSDIAATRLKGKVETNDFDVFLCHNSRDKEEVKAIGARLRTRGIYPWLDEWEIPPGARWQTELEKQLSSIRSAAVFIGDRTPGPWQDTETQMLLQRFAGSRRPLIPVILGSRAGEPRLPGFLRVYQLVDMRRPEPDPFEQLVWGITGRKSASLAPGTGTDRIG